MEKISILTPTRNRPAFVGELIKTCVDTSDNPKQLEFVFYVDDDDSSSIDYFNKLVPYIESRDESQIKVIVSDRILMSKSCNECYNACTGDIMLTSGDDLRFRTDGWDTIVRDKFNEFDDKIVLVFGKDGIVEPGTFGTHVFLHRRWVEAVGYFVPPYFSSDYCDAWLNEVAVAVGRHEYVDIYTEHMHPAGGKHYWDQTHQERLERHHKDNVDKVYKQLSDKRVEDVAKLRSAIDLHRSASEGSKSSTHNHSKVDII